MSTNSSSTDSSSTDTTPTDPSSPPGPELLAERSVLGIFVHLAGAIPLWGILLVRLLYRFSSHGFTRANAKNAFNWSLLVTGSWVGAFAGLFGISALTDRIALPGVLETLLSLPVLAAVLAVFALTWLSFVLPLIAMGKAVFGGAWEYPFVPDFLHLVGTRSRFERE